MTATSPASDILPIDQVARRLGIRASAIRYYEQRGLLEPVSRHSGRRWYGPAELRRLAIIKYWQESGLMSLEEIAEVLARPATKDWKVVMEERIAALNTRIEQMRSARDFLEHVLSHHPDSSPDGCAHYEALIWESGERGRRGPHGFEGSPE